MFFPTVNVLVSTRDSDLLKSALIKKKIALHIIIYIISTAPWAPLSVSRSVSLSLSLSCLLLSVSPSFFPCLLYCYQVRNVPVIDAHQCTASDRSRQHEKRSCWNKYICNEGKRVCQMVCQFVFVKGCARVALTYRSIMELLLKSFGWVYTWHHTHLHSLFVDYQCVQVS